MCTPTCLSTNGRDTPSTTITSTRRTGTGIRSTLTRGVVQKTQQTVPPFADDHEVVDESSSVTNPNMKETKSVSFDPKVRVYLHIHYQNMSSRMITNAWYGTDEFLAMSKEASACIAAAQTNPLQPLQGPPKKSHSTTRTPGREDEVSCCCLRGLEYRTLVGSAERLQRKQRGWDAVLREQDRQWSINNFKDIIVEQEMIARAYSIVSQKSIIEARVLALQDALDVSTCRYSV